MDKFVCIGKNYLDHAKELGDAVPEMPVLFLKPPSASLLALDFDTPLSVPVPRDRGSLHHECEIVVRLNDKLQIDAVTLGLDMTLRDVQANLKKNGHPWEVGKVFFGAALLGPWIPIDQFSDYLQRPFQLFVNGQARQNGLGTDMRVNPNSCVQYAAQHFPLVSGDAIFTGTPSGVGPVRPGDRAKLVWNQRTILQVDWTY